MEVYFLYCFTALMGVYIDYMCQFFGMSDITFILVYLPNKNEPTPNLNYPHKNQVFRHYI